MQTCIGLVNNYDKNAIYKFFLKAAVVSKSSSGCKFSLVSLFRLVRGWASFFAHWIRISDILPWDRKSYLTHAILPRLSHEGYIHRCIGIHAHDRQVTSLLC